MVEAKLGRSRAAGQIAEEDREWGIPPVIEVDPRNTPRQRMEVIIHEMLHHLCPDKSETWVRLNAKKVRNMLWKDGYRRIYHEPKEKPHHTIP